MKERKVRDRHTGARTLVVHTVHGESLNYELAEWLRSGPSPSLLPFKYEMKGGGKHRSILYYDITGCVPLRDYLKVGVSGEQYVRMLCSIGLLGNLASATSLPLETVSFTVDDIYVNQGNLVFCCLPIAPVPAQSSSVLSVLSLLANPGNVRFVLPDDARLTRNTLDYVRRSSIFSSFDFNDFLLKSFGVDVGGRSDFQPRRAAEESDYGFGGDRSGTQTDKYVSFSPFDGGFAGSAVSGYDAGNDCGYGSDEENSRGYGNNGNAGGNGNGNGNDDDDTTLPGLVHVSSVHPAVAGLQSSSVDLQGMRSGPSDDSQTLPSLHVGRTARAPVVGDEGGDGQAPAVQASSHTPASSTSVSASTPAASMRGGKVNLNSRLYASFCAGASQMSDGAAGTVPGRPILARASASEVEAESVPAAGTDSDRGTQLLGPPTLPGPNSPPVHGLAGVSRREFSIVRDRDGSHLCHVQGSASLGRSSRCTARLRGNTNVSRMHAMVVDMDDGEFSVEDLGSGNGTTVRGVCLGPGQKSNVSAGERFNVADETVHIEL